MRRVRRAKRNKGRRGAAVVEFAIVAPLFFLLVLGFIELGRAFMVQQVLTNASRVGARQAITLGGTQAEVESAVGAYTDGMGISGTDTTVDPAPETAVAGDAITVTVAVPYTAVSWLPAPKYLTSHTLTATSVMRKEGFE